MGLLRSISLTLLLLLVAAPLRADVLVLVHGYLGSAHSWESSGVNDVLADNGWHRAGLVAMAHGGPRILGATPPREGNKVYAVELPSVAPLMIQADQLQAMLGLIASANPDEPMILAGHSAGGVVARIALVRNGAGGVKGLVSIAAPQLGTARAVQALEATDGSGLLGGVKEFLGGGLYRTVKHSRGALIDLSPAYPGSLLYWLNGRAHPDIRFHSVVRTGPTGSGDALVPLFSQDLNNVPALRGRSDVTAVAAGHGLSRGDGHAIAHILRAISG